MRTFYAKSAVFRIFSHFLALFLESAETPLSVQIHLFAVWALRLDRKYTKVVAIFSGNVTLAMSPFALRMARFVPLAANIAQPYPKYYMHTNQGK